MKANLLTFTALGLIIALGSYLRFANLGNNPNGLYVDEASTGYNAYSILMTGKDEYGKDFPLAFRFLGSYTPPIYTYLTQIPIYFFGLSIASVRLISAISGILLIPIVFFFIKSLNFKKFWTKYVVALFFAVSPWDIFYSRIGYETHLAFLFYVVGILFLWQGLYRKFFIVLAAFFLAMSANTYQTERLLAPLTFILYMLIFKRINILGIIVYFIVSIPQILIILTPAGFSKTGLFYSDAIFRQMKELALPNFLSFPIAFFREFFSQYFAYFSPRNLFFQPEDDLQRSLPELSVVYSWMVVFYILGLGEVIKLWKNKAVKFIVMLLVLAPIPAALTGDPFSTQRALPLLLAILSIIALGVDKIIEGKWQQIALGIIILITFFSLLFLYRSQAVLLPNERATTWGYGFEKLADEIRKRPDSNFLIDYGSSKPAYIELAFYLKTPPQTLQLSVNQRIKKDYYHNTDWDGHYHFDNIETSSIYWEEDIYENQILVGDELSISELQAKEHFLTEEFEIRGPSKDIIFKGFKTNPELKCRNSKGIPDKHCKVYE